MPALSHSIGSLQFSMADSQTMLNGHQARWLLQLAPYDFTIHYHKGSLNPADGPSCRPDYLEEQEAVEQTAVGKLMPSLVNKLATADTIRAGVQCHVREIGRASCRDRV